MHLYLSPHADDAALSCGAQIAMFTRRHDSVLIWTLMGGFPDPATRDFPLARHFREVWNIENDVTALRRREDVAATATLGAGFRHGDWVEAIYRGDADGQPLYTELPAINGDIHPDDPLLKLVDDDAAVDALFAPFGLDEHDTIHVPLGVGAHVDHLLVRRMALRLGNRHPHLRMVFYEEYPYVVYNPRNVAFAVSTFGAVLRPAPTPQVDENAITQKIRAIACYSSQLKMIWPTGLPGMAVRTWQYMQKLGEVDWELV
jgi:LmbE family N-acetylglucosaminyl deacetylase